MVLSRAYRSAASRGHNGPSPRDLRRSLFGQPVGPPCSHHVILGHRGKPFDSCDGSMGGFCGSGSIFAWRPKFHTGRLNRLRRSLPTSLHAPLVAAMIAHGPAGGCRPGRRGRWGGTGCRSRGMDEAKWSMSRFRRRASVLVAVDGNWSMVQFGGGGHG